MLTVNPSLYSWLLTVAQAVATCLPGALSPVQQGSGTPGGGSLGGVVGSMAVARHPCSPLSSLPPGSRARMVGGPQGRQSQRAAQPLRLRPLPVRGAVLGQNDPISASPLPSSPLASLPPSQAICTPNTSKTTARAQTLTQ